MSRRKLRAAPALRAYIKRFAPKPAAPKAPPVDFWKPAGSAMSITYSVPLSLRSALSRVTPAIWL